MRIRIHSEDCNLNLRLPTNLIFSDLTAVLGGTVGKKYAGNAMEGLTPGQMKRLFREFRRIKRQYGSWELVDVRSSNGDTVKVIL